MMDGLAASCGHISRDSLTNSGTLDFVVNSAYKLYVVSVSARLRVRQARREFYFGETRDEQMSRYRI